MIPLEQYADWFRQNEGMNIVFLGDEENTIEANGLYIRPEQVIEERKTISKTLQVEVTEYVISGVTETPGTFFEPPDYDEEELARERNFGNALLRVLLIEKEDDIRNGLGSWEECTEFEAINKALEES
jgi:hypothetical protein